MGKNKIISLFLILSLGLSSSAGYAMHTKKKKEQKEQKKEQKISSDTETRIKKSFFWGLFKEKEKITKYPNGNTRSFNSSTEIDVNWKPIFLIFGSVASLLVCNFIYKWYKKK